LRTPQHQEYVSPKTLSAKSVHPQLSSCAEREAAFDELNGAFDRHLTTDGQQQVKMVRHNHEFVQTKFSLRAIFAKHRDK
jgi:hypothetical protein